MTRRAINRLVLAGATAGLVSGCGLLPLPGRLISNAGPAEPFADFTLTNYLSGSIWKQLRVFSDGAGLLLSINDGVGGMIEPKTLDKLRSLLGSADFRRDLTRPLDDIEARVCTGQDAMKTTFRMGGLTADLPCANSDRPALDEFDELLQPYWDGGEFDAELPSGQSDLPTIRIHEESDGRQVGKRYEVRPDGIVLESYDSSGEPDEVTLNPSDVDALRLILRTEPCASTKKPSLSLVYVVQVGDRDPVIVSQFAGELYSDCLDYHAIAQIITSPL